MNIIVFIKNNISNDRWRIQRCIGHFFFSEFTFHGGKCCVIHAEAKAKKKKKKKQGNGFFSLYKEQKKI